jgi:type IV fimbrial biogenesis protein FimT
LSTIESTLAAARTGDNRAQRAYERGRFALRAPGTARRRAAAGFTLLELMITITVAAIILSVGVPSFNSFIANTRATTYTNDLVLALNLARGEATRRGAAVRLCSSTNATTCNGTADWSTGWIVLTAGDDIVRSWGALDGGPNVVVGDTAIVQFQPRGSLAGPDVLFNVRIPNCVGDRGRDVSINRTGRASVTRVVCGI